jgi:t-SNARE complex subunit (syntaxin)
MRGVVDSEGGIGSLQRAALLESEVDFTSALVEERTRHIDSITGEVAEVAQLFKDLRGIVVDQGEMLATVERNAEQAKTHTQAGVQHLHAADKIDREGGCVVM